MNVKQNSLEFIALNRSRQRYDFPVRMSMHPSDMMYVTQLLHVLKVQIIIHSLIYSCEASGAFGEVGRVVLQTGKSLELSK